MINQQHFHPDRLAAHRAEFRERGYTSLGELFDPADLAVLRAEVERMKGFSRWRSFVMPGVGTARRLNTVGGFTIREHFPLVHALYENPDILGLVRAVVGKEVFKCQHEEEFMVANFLLRNGATHGWHRDDPDYALVIVFSSPPVEAGGAVELIPRWTELEATREADETVEDVVARARAEGLVDSAHHRAGESYLLHASRVLHRVAELKGEGHERYALNLAYQSEERQTYGDSAWMLYGSQD